MRAPVECVPETDACRPTQHRQPRRAAYAGPRPPLEVQAPSHAPWRAVDERSRPGGPSSSRCSPTRGGTTVPRRRRPTTPWLVGGCWASAAARSLPKRDPMIGPPCRDLGDRRLRRILRRFERRALPLATGFCCPPLQYCRRFRSAASCPERSLLPTRSRRPRAGSPVGIVADGDDLLASRIIRRLIERCRAAAGLEDTAWGCAPKAREPLDPVWAGGKRHVGAPRQDAERALARHSRSISRIIGSRAGMERGCLAPGCFGRLLLGLAAHGLLERRAGGEPGGL